jgi:hypothetical protein
VPHPKIAFFAILGWDSTSASILGLSQLSLEERIEGALVFNPKFDLTSFFRNGQRVLYNTRHQMALRPRRARTIQQARRRLRRNERQSTGVLMKRATTFLIMLLIVATQLLAADGGEAVLQPADINNKIMPEQVFFRGQSAPVQMRNTGGVRFSDGFYVLAGMVDNSGYSSDIRQKYQVYFISEVTLDIGGQKLPPGAYGVGFLKDNKFVAMDLGAHDLFQVASSRDADMKRPVPLQIVSAGGKYRLYAGRDYVEFSRTQ